MSKILYITANPKPVEKSFCLTVGNAFLNEYKKCHPQDEIISQDVYAMDIQLVDSDILNAWEKLAKGSQYVDLSDMEKKKLEKMNTVMELFLSADKYIFVSPLWNLGTPPMLKAYMDNVVIAGKTFKYTANGPIGLMINKKAVHIEACGGEYSEGPMAAFEGGNRYLKIILGFIGITELETIFVEGTNLYPEKAAEIKEHASQKAIELAKRF